MWKKYFGKGAKIIGVDINPECKQHESEGIEIFIGSQDDKQLLDKIKEKYPRIDIVLDDGSVVLVYIKNKIPATYKDLSDVRGKVISDYQSYLEKQWIDKLRKKYTIKINKEVLYSLVKN